MGFGQSVEKNLFKLDFILPGITYEHKITNKTTVVLNPFSGINGGWYGSYVYFSVLPSINLEFRYYYNLKRRVRLNKNIQNNSANYFAPRVMLEFPSIVNNYNDKTTFGAGIGGVYGIQRTYSSGIYILGEWGLGFWEENSLVFPILTFKMGYVFRRKIK